MRASPLIIMNDENIDNYDCSCQADQTPQPIRDVDQVDVGWNENPLNS